MQTKTLAFAAALTVAAAACGGGDSDNVMASGANALSPEQVDAALGPEAPNTVENEPGTADAVDAATPYRPLNATETPPAPRTADEEPADDTPDATIRNAEEWDEQTTE